MAAAAWAIAAAAQAGPPAADFDYAPRFTGKLSAYGYAADLQGLRAKTATILRDCPGKRRGVALRTSEDDGFGFLQVFPDPNQKRQPVAIEAWIDVTKLDGNSACLELDSPFVPLGMLPSSFAAFCAFRQPDDSVLLFAATPMGNLPQTLTLPPGTPGATISLVYDQGQIDASAAACGSTPQPWITGHALAFAGSTGFGFGMTQGPKGSQAGFAFAVSGDVHDPAKQDVLGDLQAAIDLENAALTDIGSGNMAQARTKLEDARKLLEEQGPQVPGSDPPTFEPDLLEKVGALPESDARADATKRLQKAAGRDAKARDACDRYLQRGKVADMQEAQKQAQKAVDDKLRAKAVLETGAVAEGKGAL